MFPDSQETTSHARLFTFRIWLVKQEDANAQWFARLQDTQSGDVKFFKDWQALAAHVEGVLQNQKNESTVIKEAVESTNLSLTPETTQRGKNGRSRNQTKSKPTGHASRRR